MLTDCVRMWCSKCQADVAAEMASDNRRLLCASCGSPIQSVSSPIEDKTRQARELLERWSKNRWSEATEEDGDLSELETSMSQVNTSKAAPAKTPVSRRRDPAVLDTGVDRKLNAQHESPKGVPLPNRLGPALQSPGPVTNARTHHRHEFSAPPPHFSGEPLFGEEMGAASTSSKLQTFWGQILAYAGVLALTVGSAFVLLAYFGGPQWQSHAPTGWLITTTGQMLLFLGVVTLVSGGMEQTTEEVARRIDRLGEKIIRIEWATQNHALKGPSIPAETFAPEGEGPTGKSSMRPNEARIDQLLDDARR